MRTITKSLVALLTLTTAIAPVSLPPLVPKAAAATLTQNATTTFTDIGQAAPWAVSKIDDAVNRFNLMSGYPSGEFRPLGQVTRQEIASILARLLDSMLAPQDSNNLVYIDPNGPVTSVFTDVPPDSWAREAIKLVTELKLMSGDGNGKFRPTDPLTREELAVILVRVVDEISHMGDVNFVFTDHAKIAPWAVDAAYAATTNGMFHVEADTFHPKQVAQRQDVAYSVASLASFLDGDGIHKFEPANPLDPDHDEFPDYTFIVRYITSTDRVVTGTAPAGATVTVTSQSGTVLGTTKAGTDRRFSLDIPPQAVGTVLKFTMNDPGGKTAEPVEVTVEKAMNVTISGKVVASMYMRPLPGLRVVLIQNQKYAQTTFTDHNGEYRFETPPGRYTVMVSEMDVDNAPWVASSMTEVRYNGTPQKAEDISVSKGDFQGRVLKADGTPAADALVKITREGYDYEEYTYTDKQGRYWLDAFFPSNKITVEALTQKQSDDAPSLPVSVVTSEHSRFLPDLKLQRADVRGTVRTHTGQAVRETLEFEVYDVQTGERVAQVETDPDGRYRIKGLTVGKQYSISQLKKNYLPFSRLAQDRFTYRGDGMSLDLQLRKPNVSGSVYQTSTKSTGDLVAGTKVVIYKRESYLNDGVFRNALTAELTTDVSGGFQADLPDGTYLLQAQSNLPNLAASAEQTVTVSAGVMRTGSSDLILRKPAIQGVVRDEQGLPVAGAKISSRVGLITEHAVTNSRGEYALAEVPADMTNISIDPPIDGPFLYQYGGKSLLITPGNPQATDWTLQRDTDHLLPRPIADPVYMNNKTITGRAKPNTTVHVLIGGHEVGRADTRADGTFSVDWFLPTFFNSLDVQLRLYATDDDFNDSDFIEVDILPAR